jgi:HK97 family phage prohead protease
LRVKTCAAQIKAVGVDEVPAEGAEEETSDNGLKAGQFEAIVSAFGNVDAVGDIVEKGAFTKSLDDWAGSGNPIPVIWSHDHGNPDAHIGVVDDAKETDAGLWIKGTVDLDEPYAAKVFKLMKGRRVTKFSFAYDVLDGVENDKGGMNLKELELWEVGPTLIPANSNTDLLAIKALARAQGMTIEEMKEFVKSMREFNALDLSALSGVKSGRVLSAKNETTLNDALGDITSAVSKIKNVVKSVGTGDDEEKAVKPAETSVQPVKGNPVVGEDPASASASAAQFAKDTNLKTMLSIDSMLADL